MGMPKLVSKKSHKKLLKARKLIAQIVVAIVTSGFFYTLFLNPGYLDLDKVEKEGHIFEGYKSPREKNWIILDYFNRSNYGAFVEKYAHMSYRLIISQSYYFKNPSLLFMILNNQYSIKAPIANASIRVIESRDIEYKIVGDTIYVRAKKPSILGTSYSFLKVEYEINEYHPNVTVFIEYLRLDDILEIIASFHNNEDFDIEHYWFLLNVSLWDLPLFTGYNIYNLTYFDVYQQKDVITPYRVFIQFSGYYPSEQRLLQPLGFTLKAKSSRTIVIVIKNGEPGSIVIWGPMGPPLSTGLTCFPILNQTGAYYQWKYFERLQWPNQFLPFNISNIEVIGNRKVIVKIIPNNNTAADRAYLVGLRLRQSVLVQTVQWTYDELSAKKEKTVDFTVDLSGYSRVEVEILNLPSKE